MTQRTSRSDIPCVPGFPGDAVTPEPDFEAPDGNQYDLVMQLDLLAMSHSYAMAATPVEGMEDEWTQVVYTPVADPPEGDPT